MPEKPGWPAAAHRPHSRIDVASCFLKIPWDEGWELLQPKGEVLAWPRVLMVSASQARPSVIRAGGVSSLETCLPHRGQSEHLSSSPENIGVSKHFPVW